MAWYEESCYKLSLPQLKALAEDFACAAYVAPAFDFDDYCTKYLGFEL